VKLLRHDPHTLSAAYALDALDDTERERFEHHLRGCQDCLREVRDLRETATRLALAVAQAPPPQLRERVLDAATRTAQNPPVAEQRPAGAARHARAPRHAWIPRLAGLAAAAAVAAAVVLGITQAATQGRLDRVQAQEQAIAAVLNAPDARIVTHRATVGGRATVVFSHASKKLIITTAGLPPLPASKVYELWLLAPGSARPAGLLPAPAGGRTAPLLASGLAAGDTAGVTVEPAGGTSQPTTKPILDIPLIG
jgi:anti-sigma-K factor RskA